MSPDTSVVAFDAQVPGAFVASGRHGASGRKCNVADVPTAAYGFSRYPEGGFVP